MASSDLVLPSGFRFHPSDEELVMHYLCRKCAGLSIPIPIIAEVDIYKYKPCQLPGMAVYGEKEWYFFSPRDRKYPNGSRPNRAAGTGYWKATGVDKVVRVPKTVAVKKALVFYDGKAPKGEKTNWIMHEFRLAGVHPKKQSRRLDEWVLCRIYNKKGFSNTPGSPDRKPSVRSFQSPPPSVTISPRSELPFSLTPQPGSIENLFSFNASESMPRLLADSGYVTCDREAQSEMEFGELERALDSLAYDGAGFIETGGSLDPLQDMFMYLRNPFLS